MDDLVNGFLLLMNCADDIKGPVNISNSEIVTINQLADMLIAASGKKLTKKHIEGPLGVRSPNSDIRLIEKTLDWGPSAKLSDGLNKTYDWIAEQVEQEK